MEFEIKKDEGLLFVSVSGRIDSQTVSELESELKPSIKEATKLVFDFSETEYISSAGLRLLLASHKTLKGNMTIKNANESVLDVFRITGMDTIFNVE